MTNQNKFSGYGQFQIDWLLLYVVFLFQIYRKDAAKQI